MSSETDNAPSVAVDATGVSAARPPDTSGLGGHPRGLTTLFFTEMWERFSFYGLRAILFLYMTTAVSKGGLAFEHLPRNDGLEILAAMRANPTFANVPVAIFSSSSLPRERAQMQALHIARFVMKPSDLDAMARTAVPMR